MQQHQGEENPKIPGERQRDHGRSPNQLTEPQKFFRRKIPVGELIAEKHSNDGGNGEGIENQDLLNMGEMQAGQVAKNKRQPRAPDKKFQHHHEKQFEADRIH
jgi:hypothetical protein